jgi:hypothetical protein
VLDKIERITFKGAAWFAICVLNTFLLACMIAGVIPTGILL